MAIKLIKFFISFAAALLIGAVLVALLFSMGCQMAPSRDNYGVEECYCYADCLYRNKGNDDKSICAMLAEGCRDSLKEKRIYERLEYCSKTKLNGMTENECRLFLNQK